MAKEQRRSFPTRHPRTKETNRFSNLKDAKAYLIEQLESKSQTHRRVIAIKLTKGLQLDHFVECKDKRCKEWGFGKFFSVIDRRWSTKRASGFWYWAIALEFNEYGLPMYHVFPYSITTQFSVR